MTTKELIEKLREADPDGTKEVGLSTDGSGRATNFEIDASDNADWLTLDG